MIESSKRRTIVRALCNSMLFVWLLGIIFAIPAGSQTRSSGIEVKLSTQNYLHLQIALCSLAKVQTTIYKSDLPWELRHSMILAAVTPPDSESLAQSVIAGDPSPARISLKPNECVHGEIDLQKVFTDLPGFLKKSDVLLFWAYRSPEGLNLPPWSGGWILLPQVKHTAK